jgi:hypothetical protein
MSVWPLFPAQQKKNLSCESVRHTDYAPKNSEGRRKINFSQTFDASVTSGVYNLTTIFGDFRQFSVKKIGAFLQKLML